MASFRSQTRHARMNYDVIPPEPALTRSPRKPFPQPVNEVVDADFEVVPIAPKRPSHRVFNDNGKRGAQSSAFAPRSHFGMAAAGSTARAAAGAVRTIPLRGLFGLAAVVLVTLALAIHFGPGAFTRPKGGLVISDVRHWPVDSNGLRVVELTGNVENLSDAPMSLPALVAKLTSETGAINETAISLGDGLLAPGKVARFTLRIPSPGGKRQQVSVSFASKGV